MDISWRRVAVPPRVPRGSSVEAGLADAARIFRVEAGRGAAAAAACWAGPPSGVRGAAGAACAPAGAALAFGSSDLPARGPGVPTTMLGYCRVFF